MDFLNAIVASANGWRVVDGGRDIVEMHPGALGVVAGVLGIILWALAVTALVLAIITMIRRLRRPGAPLVVGPGPGFSAIAPVPVEPPVVAQAVAVPATDLTSPAPAAAGAGTPSDVAPAVPGDPVASTTALQILNDRFARGEIGQEEYLERRKTLLG